MADFNVDVAKAQGAGTQSLAPVQNLETPMGNPWVPFAAGAAGMLLNYVKDKKDQEKQAQIDAVVGQFTRDQVSISDAVAQGAISPAAAAARSRANFSKYSAQYPQLIKHFKDSNSALMDNGDLGEFKEAEQAVQDRERKLETDMVAAGYPIYEGMPKQSLEAMKTAFLVSRKAQAEAEWQNKQNAENRAQAGENRAAQDWANKEKSARLLSEIGAVHVPATIKFLEGLPQLASTPDGKKQAELLLAQHFANIDAGINAAAGIHPDLASGWRSLFNELRASSKDFTAGNTDLAKSKELLERIKVQSELFALNSSPEMRSLYALNKLAPQAVANSVNLNKAALDVFIKGTSEPGIRQFFLGDKTLEKDLYEYYKGPIEAVRKGHPDSEEIKKGLSIGTGNILSQVDNALAMKLKAEDMSEVASFLASPKFGFLVDQKLVNKDQAKAAKTTFEYIYEREVSNSVVRKLGDKMADGSTYGDKVDLRWAGTGLVVEKKFEDVKPGWSLGGSGAFKNLAGERVVEVRREQQQFARDLEPVSKSVTNLVRIGAHLEGHRDYALYWEENKHRIMPGYFPDPELSDGMKERRKAADAGKTVVNSADIQPGFELEGFVYQGGDPTQANAWKRK